MVGDLGDGHPPLVERRRFVHREEGHGQGATRLQDASRLNDRLVVRPPDAPEAGNDVEAPVIPGKGVHVAVTNVAVRTPGRCDRRQPLRGVQPMHHGASSTGHLGSQLLFLLKR